ncbi:MAG: glycosyltransferase [Sarcina sp.]
MDYSICIRTLGRGGEKYKKLLKSIKNLNEQPKEVIIVIAEGYPIPEEQLGYEKFVFSPKGMLLQRIVGIEKASSEYVLLLDDDIEFKEDLVDKLFEPIKKGLGEITFPIHTELLPATPKEKAYFNLLKTACPRKQDKYVKIISSGGISYFEDFSKLPDEIESESAPGMCVLGLRKAFLDANFRDELWVDSQGYALEDDTILIYKPYLNGYKTIGKLNVDITHLDNVKNDNSRELIECFAAGFSHMAFWRRFVYAPAKSKLKPNLGIIYWLFINISVFSAFSLKAKKPQRIKAYLRGIKNGTTLKF